MTFGDLDIFLLSDGTFRLDGGAMFGVVPRVLWERHDPPDERNRILLGLNALLIMRGREKILIDCGIGDKFDRKFAEIYAIRREHTLLDELARHGCRPEDITHVLLSHLHFDHIGWSTRRTAAGELVPTFSQAEYFCQRGNYEYGLQPDPRSRASYLQENFVPLQQHGVLRLLEGSGEVLPGIESIVTGGHTTDHAIIKIKSAGRTLCFLADLVPTASHLRTPYVMGYDLFPLQTMQVKPVILQQAFAEQWLLIFEHGAQIKAGYLQQVEDNWKINPVNIE
ncbi:MAG: MBL fold metallo-hydrolase [candidate division KSB1 bacterium]|nr:MBL fold metallo-hydrolase [candidate division KSB1 bacterium]MDZ7275110.1 MBL fold metallo-hydrolase [candidate division KSB1 bacterium]MDZ7286442.1 MBL fold metallo-hydrolase [candidate division KSB1 bacterium]MDZ7299394.1 MBL fold metallo-hydrolase [candidate division KSB1 bacterium]MDZ7307828.1 MBL fold metallo-hydrolase [candidate division KSB1 bacterium]